MADEVLDRLGEITEGRQLAVHGKWAAVRAPGTRIPLQGWKIHVSARPVTLGQTVELVLPVLLAAECEFSVVRSARVLRELNAGDAATGHALTVHAADEVAVRLIADLATALTGLAAPEVTAARRFRPDAPVYYRFGSFTPQFRVDEYGEFEAVVRGPGGEVVPEAAGSPPWVHDPFPRTDPVAETGRIGRYRVISGPHGNVYRALGVSGDPVVVKRARAFVGEDDEGIDLRWQLRNERRVLQALAGVDGVPSLLDHFRIEENEYLVTTDAGDRSLAEAGPVRRVGPLAAHLVGVLDAVHARGVVVRDLSPKNVVLGDRGCTLVDFGTSRYDGYQLPGWTPGYSVPDQCTDRAAVPEDDYFSLGATLFFAATGLDPVTADPDPLRNLDRTLLAYRRVESGGLVPRLLSLDPAQRTAAVADVRAGRRRRAPQRTSGGPEITPELLESAIDCTVAECVRHAEELVETEPLATNVYRGTAGIGMELLHHTGGEAVARELARWTVERPPPAPPPNGLFSGRTGTALFLATAGLPQPTLELAPDEGQDYVHGAAGIGIGHLLLQSVAERSENFTIADECARLLLTDTGTERGYARGHAGIAAFLLAHHRATGDPATGSAAIRLFDLLRTEVAERTGVLRRRTAPARAATWWEGMAGLIPPLLAAARAYGDTRYLDLAKEGARACLTAAPRVPSVCQSHGLAGIGETLVDVALATGDDEFWTGATGIAELILLRSGGGYDKPLLPGDGSWAGGAAGVLGFLRRLHERAGSRPWTPEWSPPRALTPGQPDPR
ncbi:lanthionine synthetase LanC family protein [Amycolatopsis magusensis]|uniref:class III lanthionine synthetase LanKC N-terminal domain-containing protein n=1 Tax=Amycolatopsis magusensis TaxID=882444 RepID=UPI0024A9E267|nr:lanthionine synthetase LanC family protein [Amycolatopsis magusensis]MDI5974890.1 lanthionine synthetase LanC family protein [Amycolatopsis magusensis]